MHVIMHRRREAVRGVRVCACVLLSMSVLDVYYCCMLLVSVLFAVRGRRWRDVVRHGQRDAATPPLFLTYVLDD